MLFRSPVREEGKDGRVRFPRRQAMVRLARLMDTHGDPAADTIWKRLAMPETETKTEADKAVKPSTGNESAAETKGQRLAAAEAWLRLGVNAEKRGEAARAAECYDKLLALCAGAGDKINIVLPADPFSETAAAPADDWLRKRIGELRRKK